MVEFFIKRLKLWMGLTKPKEVGSVGAVVPFTIEHKEYWYVIDFTFTFLSSSDTG